MMGQEQGLAEHTYRVAKEQLTRLTRFLKEVTAPAIAHVGPKLDPLFISISPYFNRAKEFYGENQLVILVAGAVVVTYLVVRPKETERDRQKQKQKEKRKRGSAVKPQLGNKTFMSDTSELDGQEQPSTGTRREVESSGRQAMQRKKMEGKCLERIESSSEEEESGDKIFFEVYKTYQVSSNK